MFSSVFVREVEGSTIAFLCHFSCLFQQNIGLTTGEPALATLSVWVHMSVHQKATTVGAQPLGEIVGISTEPLCSVIRWEVLELAT
jgi:hypothetical protein